MTVGELTVVIAYLGAVYGPLSSIAHTTGRLNGALAGREARTGNVRAAARDHRPPGRHDATDIKGHIRVRGVGFTYPNGTIVLRDISFEANPGEMVALVGLTGAGKTTLVSLIPRFYDATEGRVHDR